MATDKYVSTGEQPAAPTLGASLLVLLSISELATLVLSVPAPVRAVSLLLVPVGLVAAAGIWQGRGWGVPLGAGVAAITAVKAGLGLAVSPVALTRGISGAAAVLALACCALLLGSVSRKGRG